MRSMPLDAEASLVVFWNVRAQMALGARHVFPVHVEIADTTINVFHKSPFLGLNMNFHNAVRFHIDCEHPAPHNMRHVLIGMG